MTNTSLSNVVPELNPLFSKSFVGQAKQDTSLQSITDFVPKRAEKKLVNNYKFLEIYSFKYLHNNDNCIGMHKLTFLDYVAEYEFTASNLIFYPNFTKDIRNLRYPFVKSVYDLDIDNQGLEFLEKLYLRFKECQENHQTKLANAKSDFNAILKKYGSVRLSPIINSFDEDHIEINGVEWNHNVRPDLRSEGSATFDLIYKEHFYGFSYHNTIIKFESAILGTSLVCLNVTHHSETKLVWLDLSTSELVDKP